MVKSSTLASVFLICIAFTNCTPNETKSLLKDKENLSMTILRLKQPNEELVEENSTLTTTYEAQSAALATLRQKQDALQQDYSRLSEDFRKKNEEFERLKQNSSSSRAIFESKSASNKH